MSPGRRLRLQRLQGLSRFALLPDELGFDPGIFKDALMVQGLSPPASWNHGQYDDRSDRDEADGKTNGIPDCPRQAGAASLALASINLSGGALGSRALRY